MEASQKTWILAWKPDHYISGPVPDYRAHAWYEHAYFINTLTQTTRTVRGGRQGERERKTLITSILTRPSYIYNNASVSVSFFLFAENQNIYIYIYSVIPTQPKGAYDLCIIQTFNTDDKMSCYNNQRAAGKRCNVAYTYRIHPHRYIFFRRVQNRTRSWIG